MVMMLSRVLVATSVKGKVAAVTGAGPGLAHTTPVNTEAWRLQPLGMHRSCSDAKELRGCMCSGSAPAMCTVHCTDIPAEAATEHCTESKQRMPRSTAQTSKQRLL